MNEMNFKQARDFGEIFNYYKQKTAPGGTV